MMCLNVKKFLPYSMVLSFVCLTLALVSMAGCQNTVKISDKDLKQISYSELNELLTNSKPDEVVLVDVRKDDKFNKGHIPGAINIFLPDLVVNESRLAKAKHIIVYGGGWDDPLPRAAGKRLLALEYKGVREFQGGTVAWTNEGRMLAVIRENASTK